MEPLFSHGKKRISDSEISRRDARKISGEMGFHHSGARRDFEEALEGSVTREGIHDKLQEMVSKGEIPEKKAREITRKMGIERKDLRAYEDISEWENDHPSSESQEQKNVRLENESAGSEGVSANLKQNPPSSDSQNVSDKPKTKSIWSFLNRSKTK